MDVPLVSVAEHESLPDNDNGNRRDRGNVGVCESLRRLGRGVVAEAKSNVLKGLLILATIIMSTYTAYLINNLEMKNELLRMQLQRSRMHGFCFRFGRCA